MKAQAAIQTVRRHTPKLVRDFLIGFTIAVVATIDGSSLTLEPSVIPD